MQKRLYSFDVLKGIAIFMVVLAHVIEYGMTVGSDSVLSRFVWRMPMPLFFFISGWFSARVGADGNLIFPSLGKRFRQLVVPMVAVSSLWVLYYPYGPRLLTAAASFGDLWLSPGKGGYWFNITLFEIIALFGISIPVLGRLRTVGRVGYVFVVYGTLFLVDRFVLAGTVSDVLCLYSVCIYWVVFMFGVLARTESARFMRLLADTRLMSGVFVILAFSLAAIVWRDSMSIPGPAYMALIPLMHITLSCITLGVVLPWCTEAEQSRPGAVMNMWMCLGRNSLAIYLLHFFFLWPVEPLQAALCVDASYIVPSVFFAGAVVAAIIAVVMLLIAVMRPAGEVKKLLTGS